MGNLQIHVQGIFLNYRGDSSGSLFWHTRFLGTRPVRLIRVQIQHQPAILALSSRTWLNYTHQNLMHFTPLIFENLDYAWSFSAELCPEGLIGITGSVLR